ncbi:ras and Rab interactor 1-like [Sparus aurata]|uniref:ras and Rab interactor 1-like n=1 Tax=Sparus aurata TaxID=8175 RepID=UPI0011C1B707|nr:ras and Rab interactor 1-like [Sparus aurata]
MAQQEEPLYDFPEPSQSSQRKLMGHHRGRGSLRSISVLDRLLLTVPVWLQLSINPATALHILQREPPGNFLVRKSRTSQRNVLCVRLADDSVPSFVQQFGIREEQTSKTLSLETSAISFPDLPRLISFYCVSRDVLPFPLELPEAIAKASSHKELESISHMGIEFWSSHLNVRGPREAPKPQKEDKEEKAAPPAAAAPQTSSAAQPDSAPKPDSDSLLHSAPESDSASQRSGPGATLFHEFCPITTRSPRELDCGSGMGALCFINPLFLQSQTALSRRRMFKRSLKVRISTESSTLLSPPLAPPPPPPLMPKAKGKCKAVKQIQQQDSQLDPTVQDAPSDMQDQVEPGQTDQATAPLPTLTENLQEDSDYMQPSPMVNLSKPPLLSPYLSPSASPMAPPLFPKVSRSFSPHRSPGGSPSLSPYQSPSPSPKAPFSLSPFTSPSFSPLAEQAYHTPAAPSRPDQQRPEEEGAGVDENKDDDDDDETDEEPRKKQGEEEEGLVLGMNAASLSDTDSCSSFCSLEGAAETPPHSPVEQVSGTSR